MAKIIQLRRKASPPPYLVAVFLPLAVMTIGFAFCVAWGDFLIGSEQ